MTPFRNAQAADPFDPAPTLIWADWLEERGDAVAAGVLRGLAGAGTPSLIAAALEAARVSVANYPDYWRVECNGYGYGDGWGLDEGEGGNGTGDLGNEEGGSRGTGCDDLKGDADANAEG